MPRVARITVDGLYGYVNHEVDLREDSPTLVLGPNGAGKTQVLKLTAAALSLEVSVLFAVPFRTLTVKFDDARSITFERRWTERHQAVEITASPNEGEGSLTVTSDEIDELRKDLPDGVRQVGPDEFVSRAGNSYNWGQLSRRFRLGHQERVPGLSDFPAIEHLCRSPYPLFIDTWRLDARSSNSGTLGEWGRMPQRSSSTAASRIRGYTTKLRDEIVEARRASVAATQSADLSFAARALQAAHRRVNEVHLHDRYNRTVERYEALARNGLATGEAPMAFPDKTTATERRILEVFLDDWDRRLEPLLPVNEKLEALRQILDSKLAPSGKRTAISADGYLEFHGAINRKLAVSRLSSGEQHLVALFTLLLFAAKPNSLVLIDEPEISLHAAWKHSFLHDIGQVAAINNLQIVVATHSAGIVNGRWDLVEELTLQLEHLSIEPSESRDPDGDEDELDE